MTLLGRNKQYLWILFGFLIFFGARIEQAKAKSNIARIRCVRLFQKANRCSSSFKWYPYKSYQRNLPSKKKLFQVRTQSFCQKSPLRFRLLWLSLKPCLKKKRCKSFAYCFERASRKLAENTNFAGIRCKAGHEVRIYRNGRLRMCTLEVAQKIRGVHCRKEAHTLFHPNGRVWQSKSDARIFHLGKQKKVSCGKGSVSFFPDGSLNSCTLVKPQVFNGISLDAGTISFRYDGSLIGGTLSKKQKMYGFELPAKTSFFLDKKGQLKNVYIPIKEPIVLQGLTVAYRVEFYPNKKLARVHLYKDATLYKHKFKKYTELWFRPNGSLAKAKYVEKRGFLPHGEEWTDTRHLFFNRRSKKIRSFLKHWQSKIREPRLFFRSND